MQKTPLLFLPLLACSLQSCMITDGKDHTVQFDLDAATHYVHRGMTQNERGVLQSAMNVNLPTKDTGSLDVGVWGNVDLQDSTGDAWFPDDNQGRLSEIDFTFAYSRQVDTVAITAGLVNYNLLNGSEFAFGPAGSPRGPTTELFVMASTEVGGVTPSFEIHYDVDEVEDFYLRGGVGKSFDVAERTTAEVAASLGWSGSDESWWNYGVPESGLADLQLKGTLAYQYDEHTTLRFMLAASTMVDSDIREWFDVVGIDSSPLWASIGVGWQF